MMREPVRKSEDAGRPLRPPWKGLGAAELLSGAQDGKSRLARGSPHAQE